MELINAVYPCSAAKIIVPSNLEDYIPTQKFKKEIEKYKITNIPQKGGESVYHFYIYSLLPGKKIKIRLNGRTGVLKELIRLIYGDEKAISFHAFENGNADLTGDLERMRQYYIQFVRTKMKYNVLLTEHGVETV